VNRAIALLVAGAALAAPAPLPVQLAFAIFGIGIVGMVHGAGDLAVVAPARRPLFLAAYGLVSLATLLWWAGDPAVALPAFLIASAVHFGLEDAPNGAWFERIARGTAMIAAPATLHTASYAALLQTAGGPSSGLAHVTTLLAVAGAGAGIVLLAMAWARRDLRLADGVMALVILPPLIGFTLGFLVLHALPQTTERRDRLGCSSTMSYLVTVAPVFVGAVLLAGVVAALLLHFDPSGVRGLFAGIAALAVPHLLVTPWFEGHTMPRRAVLVPEIG
jgi:Brp/Blh family beta-carotene 15,15'-monooxygenase